MTKSPSAIEFKETVRDAFGYLGRDFAFREVEPPGKHVDVNPFVVCFANATTLVQVEGINYGFAAQVILGPADAPDAWDATVPLWAIIKHRRPDLYEGAFSRSSDQLADIRVHARALREAADDVLQGDFGVFDDARAIIDAQMIHQRLTEQEESRKYHQQIAVARAAEAFRAKDFNRVIELLSPHADYLTPAERAKLDYARARFGRKGSEPSRHR
jgi:hypothetical protein